MGKLSIFTLVLSMAVWKFLAAITLSFLVFSTSADYEIDLDDFIEEYHVENSGVARRSLPNDVYPELMIVVGPNLRTKIGGSDDNVRTYIRRLFSNIQTVYDAVKQPRFHFRIADIFLCKTSSDCSFITKNTVGSLLRVDNNGFLQELVKWAQSRKSQLASYDLLMALTSLEMHRVVNADGTAPRGTGLAGKAYLGAVCGNSNVGVATDNGGFEGIKVISHEMGHLFGAVHDGSPGGGEACSPADGYIMGGSSNPKNLFRPSPCTIRSWAKHLSSTRRDCLRVDRPGKYQLDHTLPGSLKTTDDQCRQKYGPKSKNCPFFGDINSEVCSKHWCYYPTTGTCRTNGAAFSGTPCDPKNPEMHCYMSYGCVHKSFKAPTVDVDLSDYITPPPPPTTARPTRRTTRIPSRTTPPPDENCRDAYRTHLQITNTGKMTNCTENFRLYPETFCAISWVRQKCCDTARKCLNPINDLDMFG